jgi:hypothetical protein
MFKSPLLYKFIKRLSQSDPPGRKTAPATKQLVRLICRDSNTDSAIKLGVLLAFNGLLRSREYSHPSVKHTLPPQQRLRRAQRDDITISPDGSFFTMRVFGKSDLYNHGPAMYFTAQPGDPLCVVAAMISYLSWRDAKFNATDPLLIKKSGLFVTRNDIAKALKKHSLACGIRPTQVSSHSLRYGGAFELYECGASWPDIIARGRWTSEDAKKLAMQYAGFSKSRTTKLTKRLRLDQGDSAQMFAPL